MQVLGPPNCVVDLESFCLINLSKNCQFLVHLKLQWCKPHKKFIWTIPILFQILKIYVCTLFDLKSYLVLDSGYSFAKKKIKGKLLNRLLWYDTKVNCSLNYLVISALSRIIQQGRQANLFIEIPNRQFLNQTLFYCLSFHCLIVCLGDNCSTAEY